MSERYDLWIRGGTLYDGSGAPGRPGDVAIRGGRVLRSARAERPPSA